MPPNSPHTYSIDRQQVEPRLSQRIGGKVQQLSSNMCVLLVNISGTRTIRNPISWLHVTYPVDYLALLKTPRTTMSYTNPIRSRTHAM